MKEAMVTRTIITTEVIVLGVNEETGESENRGFNIPGKIEGSAKVTAKEKALKLANKVNTDKLFHPAVVVDLVSHEKSTVCRFPSSWKLQLTWNVQPVRQRNLTRSASQTNNFN